MTRWLIVGPLVAIGAVAGWMVAISASRCTEDAHDASASFCEVAVFGWVWPRNVAFAVFIALGVVAGYLAGTVLSRRRGRTT